MGLKGLRLWLFRLCQSRSGQCLTASSPLPPGEGLGVRDAQVNTESPSP